MNNPTANTAAATMQPCQRFSLEKAALISAVRHENLALHPSVLHESPDHLRALLGDLLISSNSKWKEDTLQLIDKVWQEDSKQQPRIPVGDIDEFTSISGTKLALWQGDITSLGGECLAIVNAANDQGLGCFIPDHKCIDNIIHRRAGPRLRMKCGEAMLKRNYPLSAGTEPIVTEAYHLPSTYVVHVTGPQIRKGSEVRDIDEKHLASAYALSLWEASKAGATTIAFPCISTGLFGFPPGRAAEVALSTVQKWLEEHPNVYEKVIFNVFTDQDKRFYEDLIRSKFDKAIDSTRTQAINLAKQWIDDADAVLICAGAGMSVKEGEMVYTNPADFSKFYPFVTKWGYRTGYEAMGLAADKSVPQTAKWAFWAKHMDNMRWKLNPNDGYKELLALVGEKDHFVLTSNVDGCFERSGFDPSRIYTPQGEWTFLQCMGPCNFDSVYEARPYLDRILPNISKDGYVPEDLLPTCPRCGANMFGNVRGGSWYLHHKYQQQNHAIEKWMDNHISNGSKVTILEIGAGFNTPTVTRFVVESFARELGSCGRFIRINPTEAEIPEDLRAVAFEEGWQILGELGKSAGMDRNNPDGDGRDAETVSEKAIRQLMAESHLLLSNQIVRQYHRHFGHFSWRRFLQQLRGK